MKVGILTLPLHTNYGGILQAYALQTTLERMGHEVVVFQTYYNGSQMIPFYKYPIIIVKRLLYKCFVNHKAIVFREKKMRREAPVLRANTELFIKRYIHTCTINSLRDISPQNYDAIIVGSDQIWRPEYVRRMWKTDIRDAFLNFTSGWNIKRVVYAASFGVDEWLLTKEETEDCKYLAQYFDAVSVREVSGIRNCLSFLGINAKQMLDPTMLLTKDDYIKFISEPQNTQNSRVLFSYMLDETPEKKELVKRVAGYKKMRISQIIINHNINIPVEERIIPPVDEWLSCIYHASMVVTDSFHGCVFSMIFEKPFIVIGNQKRGNSRFLSLLKLFHLENCLIDETCLNNINTTSINKNVLEKVVFQRRKSLQFLERALS